MADQLIVVALSAAGDGWPLGADDRPAGTGYLAQGVAGAELADLVAAGRLRLQTGDVVTAGPLTATGDEQLDAVCRRVTHERRRHDAAWWVDHLAAGDSHLRRIARLRGQGRITCYELPRRGLLRMSAPTRRLFAPEGGPEEAVLQRLGAALRDGRADEPTIALLAVMYACRMHRHWFRHLSSREREATVSRLAGGHWAGRAVGTAILRQEAASAAANGSL